ncbi:hypothetical protein Ae717Ps2_6736 [Pseudonocardia sp. Ae717_Ps2]|nr:hypothetical protein Ae717Ps2_6736 [Pseudonocardia sp. Ae717_Ps2]
MGAWLWFHKDAPKFTVLLFLIAGLGLGGVVGGVLGALINRAMGTIGTTTGSLIGIGTSTLVAGLALVATLEVAIKGIHPRKARPKRWHAFLALALPHDRHRRRRTAALDGDGRLLHRHGERRRGVQRARVIRAWRSSCFPCLWPGA